MKPVSANSPLPSLSQKDSAVPSTVALPALWRKTSTKPVKVTRAEGGTVCEVQCGSMLVRQHARHIPVGNGGGVRAEPHS